MGAAFPAERGWVLGVVQAGDAVTGGPQAWRIEGLRNAEVKLEQTIRLHQSPGRAIAHPQPALF